MHAGRGAVRGWRLLMTLLVAGFACVGGLSLLFGQERTAEVRIEVRDPSGAAAQATGSLENLASGTEETFQTDAAGAHVFERVAFGRYRVRISQAGFAPQSVVIEVRSSAPITRTITLGLRAPAFRVDVVAAAPLPGADRAPEEIPAPVRSAGAPEIEQSGALDLADALNRRFNGLYVNEVQGNPVQPDVSYRGYTVSPLLGTPQGISVYMDGVRLNQPFGDVVSWDLIPRLAIAEATLIPGSSPLFGLNTLGGALALQSKDGRAGPGTSLELGGGSFGRATADFEHGGSARGFNWYLGSSLLFEEGWRDSSPSSVRQFFGNTGWQSSSTVLSLRTVYANNALVGNGLQEQRLLARDYASVYTKPDITANRAPSGNLTIRHSPNSRSTFSGNVYQRTIRTRTLNGDINEDALDQSLYQPNAAERAALAAAGYTGFPASGESALNTPFPSWRCIAQSLLRDEPSEKCNGLLNRSRTRQRDSGVSGQISGLGSRGGGQHQWTAGAAYDQARVDFAQSTQLGYLNPDLSVTGVASFADGVTGGDQDGIPYDSRVDLDGRIRTASVFATDTLALGHAVGVVISARYNHTRIENLDRIRPAAGPGSLTGDAAFGRLNPAAGFTFALADSLTLFASYSEGSRAPTAVELGCADPETPCKLPNAMAGDPPLDQVVTRTVEGGARGTLAGRLRWNAGWFRADNRNDILFVASEQTGFGYFKNFGRTLRQGLELGAGGRVGRVDLGGGYTLLDATFRTREQVNGTGNSTNLEAAAGIPGVEGGIEIQPGNRIPLVPRHMLKAYADLSLGSRLSVDLGLVGVSGSYARGNENNRHQPDGRYYLGPGRSPGYAVLNMGARWHVRRRLEIFVRLNNVLDRRYHTAAQLGPTGFTGAGTFIARPFAAVSGRFPVQQATFFAPGAPRGAWGGMRFRF